jgi:hypothetical protein
MNDNDIQLITSLIDGKLSAADRQAALDRLATDPEFRLAYEEQRSISSLLASAARPSLTDSERNVLRSALRAELRVEDAAPPVAATTSFWARWWAPLTGLATVAVVVVAIAVLPDSGDDAAEQLADASTAAQTTVPALASEPLPPVSEDGVTESAEGAPNAASTTTAPAAETFAPESTAYALDSAITGSELELPVLNDEPTEAANLDEALTRATTNAAVDLDAVRACFPDAEQTAATLAFSLVAVTDEGTIIGVVTHPETGERITLSIDLTTCSVTSSG